MNNRSFFKNIKGKNSKGSDDRIVKNKYTGEAAFFIDVKVCINMYKMTAGTLIVMATVLLIMYVTDTSKVPLAIAAVLTILFLLFSIPVCMHDISHFCSVIEVKNDSLIIDSTEFDYQKIEDPMMTPFEFHERKIISFKYEGKKYLYFFGYYAGNGKNQMAVSIYPDICRALVKKGFIENYK